MNNDNFELDKIILAVLIGIFSIIVSANIGSLFYIPQKLVVKRGYQIEVMDASNGGPAQAQGLPDIIDMALVLTNADPEAGKQTFNKCAICHTINKGEANKIGPNLWNILGSPTAKHANFAYSSAMKKRGEEGKSWGYEDLYRYLYAPRAYVPGTKMAFAGLKKEQDRANMIAYLRAMADSPLPIPKPLPAAATPSEEKK